MMPTFDVESLLNRTFLIPDPSKGPEQGKVKKTTVNDNGHPTGTLVGITDQECLFTQNHPD